MRISVEGNSSIITVSNGTGKAKMCSLILFVDSRED